MKVFSLLFLSLVLIPIYAIEAKEIEEIWKAGDQFVSLLRDTKNNLLYSSGCKQRNCEAFLITKKISWAMGKNIAPNLGGKNPGAILCKEVLNETIIYLKDLQGNENTFCIFKGKSFISSSSLSSAATINSKKDHP